MKLINLTMTRPAAGKDITYSPSRITPSKEVSQEEFMERYADFPLAIRVDMNRDGNVESVTAYSHGLDCWWIVDSKS